MSFWFSGFRGDLRTELQAPVVTHEAMLFDAQKICCEVYETGTVDSDQETMLRIRSGSAVLT